MYYYHSFCSCTGIFGASFGFANGRPDAGLSCRTLAKQCIAVLGVADNMEARPLQDPEFAVNTHMRRVCNHLKLFHPTFHLYMYIYIYEEGNIINYNIVSRYSRNK